MWFWFVIPSATKVQERDQERRDSNPPNRESDQQESNKQRHSEPRSNEPQQSEPETSKARHSEPKSNKPEQSQKKAKRKITIPSPEVLPILKPEILCVGFIGLLHNGCWFFILAYYFVYWAFAMDQMVKDDKSSRSNSPKDNSTTDSSKKDDSYEYESLKFTKGLAIASIILHLIGLILIGFALRMDHLLRYSADPAMEVYKVARILQHYVVMNTVVVIYAVIMFFLVVCYIPPEYKNIFIGMMLGSICLRIVCADIVERYLILLAKLAGIKTCRICFCSPRRKQEVQTAPSDHAQQV